MKKEKFEAIKAELFGRGYHQYIQHWMREDYSIGNGFHRDDNQWTDDRASYQIILNVYDNTLHPEFMSRFSKFQENNMVWLDVVILVSRTLDERVEMTITWYEDTTIDEIEEYAEQFYQWVTKIWPTPREYN